MKATIILAIAAIVAGIGSVGISTHLAQAGGTNQCGLPKGQVCETNPTSGNPHTTTFAGESTGNPHQGTSSGTCQKGNPHGESGPPNADEASCPGAK